MTPYLIVALGSAPAAPARYLVDQYFKKFTHHPIGTFLVNIFGSFLIGVTFARTDRWHDFLAIGFAGSFTTWSTFMIDLYLGYELKHYKKIAINLLASLIVGLFAAWCGIQLVG